MGKKPYEVEASSTQHWRDRVREQWARSTVLRLRLAEAPGLRSAEQWQITQRANQCPDCDRRKGNSGWGLWVECVHVEGGGSLTSCFGFGWISASRREQQSLCYENKAIGWALRSSSVVLDLYSSPTSSLQSVCNWSKIPRDLLCGLMGKSLFSDLMILMTYLKSNTLRCKNMISFFDKVSKNVVWTLLALCCDEKFSKEATVCCVGDFTVCCLGVYCNLEMQSI